MSAAPSFIDVPVPHGDPERDAVEHVLVLALATADDLASAMARVVEFVCRNSGANRVEWWTTDDDGTLILGAAIGIAHGRRQDVPLGGGSAGTLVLYGGTIGSRLAPALTAAGTIIRRRAAEERLARTAITLGRRNQALEDYAALVAHELKTPLHASLLADDPSRHVEVALHLVDDLLEATRSEPGKRVLVSAAECIDRAVEDVGAEIEVTTDLTATVPLPPGVLRVILRNLLSNAVSAGANHVRVAVRQSSRSRFLVVDDDGVGLAESDRYATGSGLGLSLLRRIADRFGGVLELAPLPWGGTRAQLEFPEVPQ